MAKGLNHRSGGAARRDQMLGRSVAKIYDALSQHDAPRGAIGEIGALGRDLRRKAEHVRCPRAGDLHLGAGLPSKRMCYIVRRRRQWPELRMQLWKVVEPARKPTELSALY